MKIKLSDITVEYGVQSRKKLCQATITSYSKLMSDGIVFDPIVVFGDTNILADGWHRYEAAKLAKIDELNFIRKEGTLRDAMRYAISANNNHGLPMTAADKRANARKMMLDAEWGQLGLRTIATECGISKSTAQNIRGQLESEGLLNKSTTRTYTRDGKEVTMDVTQIQESNKKKEEEKKKEGDKKQEQPKQEPNKQEPKKEEPTANEHQLQEAQDQILILHEENQQLRDAIAIGAWDATDIEKEDIEETVKDLRNQIKILEMENDTLRSSRDMYMNQAAELERINKSLRNKLKKFEQ